MAASLETRFGAEGGERNRVLNEKEARAVLSGYSKNLQAFRQEAPGLPDGGKSMAGMFVRGLENDLLRFPGSLQEELRALAEGLKEDFLQEPANSN
jgi:hypothetical protein